MKALVKVALARIRRNFKNSILQSAAVFISMLVISFFVCFVLSVQSFKMENPSFGIESVNGEIGLTVISLRKFFERIIVGISFMAAAIAFLSFFSIFIYARMRLEEDKQFFATLTSIGATNFQKRVISLVEALISYGLPVVAGSFLGVIPSGAFSEMIAATVVDGYRAPAVNLLLPAALSLFGIVLLLVITRVPGVGRKKSVIQSVKSHNEREADESHNYRKSYTFRRMPVEKRLAKKSVEYYKSTYRRITFMVICCVMYPVLGLCFFALLSQTSVTDYTPNSGINVVELIEIFSAKIAVFGFVAFILLGVFGTLQMLYTIRVHSRIRSDAFQSYKSIGMTDISIKKMQKYEYGTVVFNAVIYLLFILSAIVVFINSI